MMKKKNLLRLFYMVEHNLCEQIQIGFHSHNNLQLAYSNAQSLIETQTRRRLIVECLCLRNGTRRGKSQYRIIVFLLVCLAFRPALLSCLYYYLSVLLSYLYHFSFYSTSLFAFLFTLLSCLYYYFCMYLISNLLFFPVCPISPLHHSLSKKENQPHAIACGWYIICIIKISLSTF